MLNSSCPGARLIAEPRPKEYRCEICGTPTEIWSDELEHNCPQCGHLVTRVPEQSCIRWCPAARECVGAEKYERLMGMKNPPSLN